MIFSRLLMITAQVGAIALLCAVTLSNCGHGDPAPASACSGFSGSAWSPNIAGSGASNHDGNVVITKTNTTQTGPVIGLAQAAPASTEITVSIDMTTDLGAFGSLTLIGEIQNYPSDLSGSAYPLLVSLNDGTNELINLARAGSGNDCAAGGYYNCTRGTCTANSACSISWPSAYIDRSHWEQHQAPNPDSRNAPSTNTFPTCNWSGGSTVSVTSPACAFTSLFFPASAPARLRYGGNYTAKYVLIGDSYSTLSNRTATLKLTVVKKKDTAGSGTVDLNVILVGDSNIAASRTMKGQQNLDTLITRLSEYFNQSNVNLKLGTVRNVEWDCGSGGNQYGQLKVSQLGNMFSQGGAKLAPESEGKALNLFLVSGIIDDTNSIGSQFTVLGFDGAIGGPPIHSTAVSGVTVSTFDSLDKFNPNCTSSGVCSVSSQESAFSQTAVVVAHELGHYFGLNHPSESSGTQHDLLVDTPLCTQTESVGGSNLITVKSCLTTDNNVYLSGQKCRQVCTTYNGANGVFCPTVLECQFNYVMWWTSKNFAEGTPNSDGNIFSPDSGVLVNYSPLVQ